MIEILQVTSEQAEAIIEDRQPEGCFWLQEDGKYVGIDNQTGDAWTEEFDSQEELIAWFYDNEDMDPLELMIIAMKMDKMLVEEEWQ